MSKHQQVSSESTLAHLRRKPDNYVGSNSYEPRQVYLCKNGKIVQKEIKFNEALMHLFKEIIDNAVDNTYRKYKKKQTFIKINVDSYSVSVENDGMPIPVRQEEITFTDEINKKEVKKTMYRTEAIFGFFRTGTNAKKDEKQTSIGVNGIGSKAVIGLSNKVVISHGDPDTEQQLEIQYLDAMKEISKPKIKKYKKKSGFTKFYYEPDWKWFKASKFSQDEIDYMHALAASLSYISQCKVYFNDATYNFKTLVSLGKFYFGERNTIQFKNTVNEQIVLMAQTPEEAAQFKTRQLSFVNGSCTIKGGIHVNRNLTMLSKLMIDCLKENITTTDVSNFFIIIADYKIHSKTSYNGQTKAELIATKVPLVKVKATKARFNITKKWDLWENLKALANSKTNKKANQKPTGAYIGSLGKDGSDANFAGSKSLPKRKKCELYIAEGHSAKSLIEAGQKYRGGSDYVGILAVRGKLANVKKKSKEEQRSKKYIELIRLMMGLNMGIDYMKQADRDKLRYGSLIIATDKDLDGYHIRALIYCFLETEHFGLIEHGIVRFLETPVVKTTLGKDIHRFYLRSDFTDWLETLSETKKTTAIKNKKFIKGLGGNGGKGDVEHIFGKNYFSGMLTFSKAKDRDYMEIFFGDERVDEKKKFMLETFYNDEWIHLPKKGTMTFTDFIEHIYTLVIHEQIERAVPSVYDGLIESKRMILYSAFKTLKKVTKTVIFATSVPTTSGYDHGEQNLPPTVTKMTQNIIGVNNITVFKPDGIFGNRFQDAEVKHGAAKERYTSVSLQPLMRYIFKEQDDPILHYTEKDGVVSVPDHYLPIIPWVAVNGNSAPANAWSSTTPSYNPRDLVDFVKRWIYKNCQDAPKFQKVSLVPWYRGFTGTVVKTDKSWEMRGIMTQDEKSATVTEIGAGNWGSKLQIALEKLADQKLIAKPRIIKPHANSVHAFITKKSDFDLEKKIRPVLVKKIPLSNCTLVHTDGPHTFSEITPHLETYCTERYVGYKKRRKYMIKNLEVEIHKKEEKIRYIKCVLNDKINFKKVVDKDHLIELVTKLKFVEINESWDYITNMTHLQTSKKAIERNQKEIADLEKQLVYYKENKPWQVWLDELDEFETEYEKYLQDNPVDEKFVENKK